MRRLALRIDQLPAWAFVLGAVLAFSIVRAERLFALVHANRGGMELGSILTAAAFLALVIFAVRRRHISVLRSAGHVLASVVAGNGCALVLIWPFIPDGYGVSLTPVLRDTMLAGTSMALTALPLAAGMLWLSRRFGSHSSLTERRLRAVHASARRRLLPAQQDHQPDAQGGTQ
jgi:hypothetical protein